MTKNVCWVLVAAAGCTAQPALAPVPMTQVDAAAVERFASRSAPAGPQRAGFAWALNEAGERFSGRGVARFVAPDRIRLDLFGPRGETYLAAALVGDSIRLPPGATRQITLPSPTILWAVLGVIDPPSAGRAAALTETGADSTLRYAGPGGELWEFRKRSGALSEVRRAVGRNVAESVELGRGDTGRLRSARYRNWAAYRTLELTFDSIANAEPFSEAIWLGRGAAR